MLKNLHVITGIIFALTIFCLLQVVTGGLFYSAVSNDRHNFQNSGVLNAQQESLSDSVNTLVKTRVTVTRAPSSPPLSARLWLSTSVSAPLAV